MPSQQTTPTPKTVSSGGSDRGSLPIVGKVFRCLHLVLNLICVSIAGTDYNWHTTMKFLADMSVKFQAQQNGESTVALTPADVGLGAGQSSARLFFLMITMVHMIVSFALLIWHWIMEFSRTRSTSTLPQPIYIFIYYLIGSVSFIIASIILLVSIGAVEYVFFNYGILKLAVSLAICNGFLYLASAIILWRLWKTV